MILEVNDIGIRRARRVYIHELCWSIILTAFGEPVTEARTARAVDQRIDPFLHCSNIILGLVGHS